MYNVIYDSYRRSLWHYNASCNRSCVWHCKAWMYNVTGALRGTSIFNVTEAVCDTVIHLCTMFCMTLQYTMSLKFSVTAVKSAASRPSDAIMVQEWRRGRGWLANNKYFDRLDIFFPGTHEIWPARPICFHGTHGKRHQGFSCLPSADVT